MASVCKSQHALAQFERDVDVYSTSLNVGPLEQLLSISKPDKLPIQSEVHRNQSAVQQEKYVFAFTLYALNKIDHLQQDGLTYDELIQAIKGHVGGATTIVGTFRRVPPGKDAH